MHVLESRIDTQSDAYRKNYETMAARVADLNAELNRSLNERPDKDLKRLVAADKLPTPKKLELLLDPNTPFLEIGSLTPRGMLLPGGFRGRLALRARARVLLMPPSWRRVMR